jgi:hypothetical protein
MKKEIMVELIDLNFYNFEKIIILRLQFHFKYEYLMANSFQE